MNDIRAIYPDMSEAVALSFSNKAHLLLLTEAQLTRDTEDINLVASQLEYAMPTDILKVWQAVYYDYVEGKRFVYKQVTTSELEQYFSKFKIVSASSLCTGDAMCFVEARAGGSFNIGLYPAPTVTTAVSGVDTGFPVLRLYCTRTQTLALVAGAGVVTDLPESVRDSQAYVAYACWRWSLIHDKVTSDEWSNLWRTQKTLLKASVSNMLRDARPRSDPFLKRTSRPR